jgi:hypothetical protein
MAVKSFSAAVRFTLLACSPLLVCAAQLWHILRATRFGCLYILLPLLLPPLGVNCRMRKRAPRWMLLMLLAA